MRRTSLKLIGWLLILCLAAYLRLVNVARNPGWYTDEATHLDIAQNLLSGRVQYLAINQSTLLFAKLPLFDMLLAGLLNIAGDGMAALRTFTAALGVISVVTLYVVVRWTQNGQDATLPLLAAFMLAIYPQAVLYSRFGFSYNLLTPLALLAYLGLWEYLNTSRRRWLALAAMCIGIGATSDLLMLAFVAPLALTALTRRWRDALWSAALAVLPLGLYAAAMLASAPEAFLFDLRFTLSRLGDIPLGEQIASVARNYTILIAQDTWIAAGLVGLLALRPPRLQRLSLLLFLLPIAVLGRTAALNSLSFYYMIPLLPFVAFGVAALVRYGVPIVRQVVSGGLLAVVNGLGWWPDRAPRLRGTLLTSGAYLAVLLIVAAPFVTSIEFTAARAQGEFGTSIDPFLIEPGDALRVAEFVNANTTTADLVIASPAVGWLFRAKTADFQMAVAATGRATVHLPADIPADRFVFDPRVERARFVVVDNLWRNWGVVHMPDVAALLREVEAWPLAFEAGQIAVYRNPTR